MKIAFYNKHKSLKKFTSEELPSFVIIVGKNGSGKSQLVEKLAELSKNINDTTSLGVLISPPVNSIYTESIVVDSMQFGDPVKYKSEYSALYMRYSQLLGDSAIKKVWVNMSEKELDISTIEKLQIKTFDDVYTFKHLASTKESIFVDSDLDDRGMRNKNIGEKDTIIVYNRFLNELKKSLSIYEVAKIVAKNTNKGFLMLEENDFLNSNLEQKHLSRLDLIHLKIEDVFYSYLYRRHKNNYDYYRKITHEIENSAISKQEFDKVNIDPITQINEILASLEFPYYFQNISEGDFTHEARVNFNFIKKGSDAKILFKDLSSGEKIIMGLIIRLFISKFHSVNLKFPDLIVLDEPDAHLHPQMSKLLIDVLNNTFVNALGIKVIMTTHSPSTVALAPEDSIFQLNNEPDTCLRKTSKDDALQMLTYGLPNLSIDYKNHRQVFVESPTDLLYYQILFDKLNEKVILPHRLYFISNGYGEGNCDQVKKIVRDLRQAGNTTSFGIIDWDKKNNNSNTVFVHGIQKRYSIENYLFDPIYISILLLEMNYGLLKKAIGYTDTDNQYDLIKSDKAQKAIDYIVSKLESRNNLPGTDKNLVSHKYSDYTYKIPAWYTNLNGHHLKEQLVDTFEALANIRDIQDYGLEKRLIRIIGKVYPNVPSDSVELLIKISSMEPITVSMQPDLN